MTHSRPPLVPTRFVSNATADPPDTPLHVYSPSHSPLCFVRPQPRFAARERIASVAIALAAAVASFFPIAASPSFPLAAAIVSFSCTTSHFLVYVSSSSFLAAAIVSASSCSRCCCFSTSLTAFSCPSCSDHSFSFSSKLCSFSRPASRPRRGHTSCSSIGQSSVDS